VGTGICSNGVLSAMSAGVFGGTCVNSTTTAGVRGYGYLGAGVHGEGSNTGVLGESIVAGPDGIGVVGYAGAAPPTRPSTTGVYGYGAGDLGVGGVGVYGRSNGANSVGVKGLADGAGSVAGQFVGHITVSSCAGCANPSDRRLKRDIAPSERGLGEILRLQPVSFAYNEEMYGPGPHIGFLAQDLQGILPELVEEMENGFLRIDYDEVIPILTKAIQEQQAQIEALKGGAGSGAPSISAETTAQPPTPQVTVIRESVAGSPLNGWALPGAVVFFGLGLFALAGVQLRRKA